MALNRKKAPEFNSIDRVDIEHAKAFERVDAVGRIV